MGSRITSRQVNALVLAENLAKLCIMLPLLINGVWQGRALGVFVFFCLLGAFALGLCERWMWAEDTFFHTVLYKWEIKAVFAMYGALLFFFMAQVPVMIRLSAEVLSACFGYGKGLGRYDIFFLPFLISSAFNSFFYMRKAYLRIWWCTEKLGGELPDFAGIGQKLGTFFSMWPFQEWVWWGAVFVLCTSAFGFRDKFCAVGFYCAYLWEILPLTLVFFCIFFVFLKKWGKRDCRY